MIYDEAAVAGAEEVAAAALNDFLSRRGSYGAVVLSAVAGAGKSYFVSKAAHAARREGMRIVVCAPTNEQAFSLVRSIALMNERDRHLLSSVKGQPSAGHHRHSQREGGP